MSNEVTKRIHDRLFVDKKDKMVSLRMSTEENLKLLKFTQQSKSKNQSQAMRRLINLASDLGKELAKNPGKALNPQPKVKFGKLPKGAVKKVDPNKPGFWIGLKT